MYFTSYGNSAVILGFKAWEVADDKNAVPPYFTRTLADVWCKEHDDASFECSAGGNPLPNVFWEKNEEPVDSSPRIKVDIKVTRVPSTAMTRAYYYMNAEVELLCFRESVSTLFTVYKCLLCKGRSYSTEQKYRNAS